MALLDGIGCSLAFVASKLGAAGPVRAAYGLALLSVVWQVSTLASAGPLAAGLVAGRTGGFGPILVAYALMLLGLGWALFAAPRSVHGAA